MADAKAFKKPDHEKYFKHMADRAEQVVKGDSRSFYARMCSDSLTGDWTLTVYGKADDKFFSMAVHAWDAVDDAWHKTVESKIRASQWKTHLAVAGSGKECRVLKDNAAE